MHNDWQENQWYFGGISVVFRGVFQSGGWDNPLRGEFFVLEANYFPFTNMALRFMMLS
jgi:hypothetical protein